MRVIDYGRLLLLAALWGASFLFMRITTPAFGALNSAFLRVLFAAIALGLLLGVQGKWSGYQENSHPLCSWGSLIQAFLFSCTALPRNGCRQGTPPHLTPRRR